MTNLFNGYELLLFKKFQTEPQIWSEWKEKLCRMEENDFGVCKLSVNYQYYPQGSGVFLFFFCFVLLFFFFVALEEPEI